MKAIYFILFSWMILQGCSSSDNPDQPVQPPVNIETIIEHQSDFGMDLLKQSFDVEGNSLISPLSIQMALYMVRNGAKGTTAHEMDEALKSSGVNGMNATSQYLLDKFNTEGKKLDASLRNALFYDDARLDLAKAYEDSLKNAYQAEVEILDFNKESSVDKINDWAADATNDKIKKILDEISPEEVMFLVNALYMKADWDNGFPKETSYPSLFSNLDGSQSTVDFMNNDAMYMGYTDDEVSYLAMTLADSSLVCKFIMPKTESIESYLMKLTQEDVDALDEKSAMERFYVKLPKVNLKYKMLINDWLTALGMEEIFTRQADLTGIGKANGVLQVTRVLHDTYFQMDEAGIEGAAVTTVGVGVTSAPPPLTYDRPFILLVEDMEYGTPLFSGVIHTL